jgi:CubicO group peptidase (beta-lactamase class C family)
MKLAHLLLAAAMLAASAAGADDLTGLWKAKRNFGPDARGTLVMRRTAAGWTADLAGYAVPVRADRTRLSFALPDGAGSFSGRVSGETIRGHWITPNSMVNGSKYAVPVTLTRDGTNRWRGTVTPRDDTFTLYLVINGDKAFLRNPERNFGVQANVERIVVDGNNVRLVGKRNGRGEEQDLATGTYRPDDKVLTLWIRGGSYDFRRDGGESGFYARGKTPEHYSYRPPLARDDGWPVATLAEENISRDGIEKLVQSILDTPIDSVHAPIVESVLIARHGRLVFEEYFHGEHRDKLHETRSAGKSVTAMFAGAVMQAGAPLSLSTHVYADAPDLDPRKRAMTLEHLLMMRAGFFCDDSNPDAPGNEETILEQEREPDYYRYSLAVPQATAPDTQTVYCSMMANLALGVTGRAVEGDPLDAFDRLLARPLKISTYAWPLDPAGNPYGGGGVQFLPRDFLKFGQLLVNGGTWNGQRILGRDFARRAASPLHDYNGIQYGYLWWNIEYPFKDRTVRAAFASGNGGQTVMAIPDLDLVVAIFAGNYADRAPAVHVQQELVPDFILPSVDAKGPLVVRDFQSPYGRH